MTGIQSLTKTCLLDLRFQILETWIGIVEGRAKTNKSLHSCKYMCMSWRYEYTLSRVFFVGETVGMGYWVFITIKFSP